MLPERRREWGRAMLAELAEVEGRSARWRFALSSVGVMLRLPPAGGWPVLALVAGVVVASVAAAGPAVGAAVPGLRVFAVSFTLAPHLGAAAVVFAAWFWLAIHTDGMEPPLPFVLLLALVLVSAPVAACFIPAFAAGRAGRSFRSGLQAAVWTVTAMIPLTYATWLPEGLRRHAIDGRLLVDGEVVAPRRREPGRCPGLLPRHRSRARPHARGDRRRSRREDHPSRRPRRSDLVARQS
jgi:hypothetical protein